MNKFKHFGLNPNSDTGMCVAIASDNLHDICGLFDFFDHNEVDVNKVMGNGFYLVHLAADLNAVECLKFLIEKGAEVNVLDAHGNSPLMLAVNYNHEECIDILLQAGADPNLAGEQVFTGGDSFMQDCLSSVEDVFLFQKLIEHGAKFHVSGGDKICPIFHYISMGRNTMLLELALQQIPKDKIDEVRDSEGKTILMSAVYDNDFPFIMGLLDSGADPNAVDNNGASVYQHALRGIEDGTSEWVLCLLEKAGAHKS